MSMKKILLSLFLIASLSFANQSKAQCNGAAVSITNFRVVPGVNQVFYSFNWSFVQGNASIQLVFLCNNVQVAALNCIPRLKDSTAGPHNVSGTYPINCNGVIKAKILIWTNPSCGGTNCTADSLEVTQIGLPVSFKSFTAVRNRSNVSVKWETASEINNSGFSVERNVRGTWEQVAFVPSQAAGGNSDAVLSYSVNDLNNERGVSQYRIKQIDIDAKSKFSEVRAVRGEGQAGKTTVYPNPSSNGRVNVVFEDATVSRDVSVLDMSGRIVKQFRGVTNNNIQIENLNPGMYSIKISVPATGEQTMEKIIVNKR